ncbi:MAG: HAD family phosphatase [Nitrospirae bacterium]|nr:HAD family phosphatase [Nitrospirota bacterium]
MAVPAPKPPSSRAHAGPRAIIFDCDGILADTEQAHYEAFNSVLRPLGHAMTRAEYDRQYLALNDRDCFRAFGRLNGLRWSPEEIERGAKAKARAYARFLARGRVRFYPGVRRFVRLAWLRVPLAVCSGALGLEVRRILRMGGLASFFRVIVSANDVRRGKPDPEGYRLALERLRRLAGSRDSIVPRNCLSVEDSPPGIEAARRAGMRCLAVSNSYAPSSLRAADLVVGSLADVCWADVAAIFERTK